MEFYLAPLSETHLSIISFCLIFCVCGLYSIGCRVVVPLASGVFTPVDETGLKRLVQASSLGGTGAFPLVSGAGSCPSGGQSHVKWCLETAVGSGKL